MTREGDGDATIARRTSNGRDYDERLREILDVASEVFYEKGFAQGTLSDIARQVGLTQPALYHYVASKDELLERIMLQVASDLSVALDDARSVNETATDQLRAVIRHVTAAVVANRKTFAVYWQEMKALPEPLRTDIRSREHGFVAAIRDVVTEAQREGSLPVESAAGILTSGLLGMMCWTYHWYEPDRSMSAEEIAVGFERLVGLSRPTLARG